MCLYICLYYKIVYSAKIVLLIMYRFMKRKAKLSGLPYSRVQVEHFKSHCLSKILIIHVLMKIKPTVSYTLEFL